MILQYAVDFKLEDGHIVRSVIMTGAKRKNTILRMAHDDLKEREFEWVIGRPYTITLLRVFDNGIWKECLV